MIRNIYDDNDFFENYENLRKSRGKYSINEIVEMPTIYTMLPSLKNKKVLDLGCGSGNNCQKAIELGAKSVLGIDVSKNMVELAQKENKSDKIQYKVLPLEQIDEIKESFDVIISSLALHYVKDFEKVCSDLTKILTKNGYFIFSQHYPLSKGTIPPQETNYKDRITIGKKDYALVSDYDLEGERVDNWLGSDSISYHRKISTIINTLIRNGFEIIQIEEPIPDKNNKDNLKYIKEFNLPYFIFIKTRKK